MSRAGIGAAVELLPPGADRYSRDAWLSARRTGITASEIAAILGLSRWDSPLSLYYRKLGEIDEEPPSYRMALGLALEDYVGQQFTELTELELAQSAGLLASVERPWQLCTPDRLVSPGIIPCELKTASSDDDFWGPTGSAGIPLYYRCQLLWQCDVLGADHGYLCVIFLRTGEPRWYRIDWDAEDVGLMREAGQEFWQRLRDHAPPPPDASESTTRALKALYRPAGDTPQAVCTALLKRQYAAALRARKLADERHRRVTNLIRQAMGTATRLVDPAGDTVATRRGPKDALYPARKLTADD